MRNPAVPCPQVLVAEIIVEVPHFLLLPYTSLMGVSGLLQQARTIDALLFQHVSR